MVLFWYDLLGRIHKTNLSLQKIDISLSCVVDLINSLQSFVNDLRNRNQFDNYLKRAKYFSENTYQEFKDDRMRRKKRKKASDESISDDDQLPGPDKFYVDTFLAIIDSIQSELACRKQSYQLISERFDFLSFPKEEDNIVEKCNALKKAYPMHFDDNMVNEMIQFFSFVKEPLRSFLAKRDLESSECDESSESGDREVSKPTAQFLLELIINGRVVATFPNATIALRLFLTLPCGVVSGERCFSALKRIKSPLCSTMAQERLVSLCLMSANVDVLQSLDVNEVSKKFAAMKCRRKPVPKC
jgi:hypothetical protein